ncbi:MAG: FkbM family methyltransferase [Acidimicrobiaceae bacterium]|nr:FkbM family methyltransferase [Candidatus Poribacteria bacterium]MYI36437.1 FkbM family methyltransferase [Acidimicrobiaceae bacterium]
MSETNRTGIVIQAGLGTGAEYLYLSKPDWKKYYDHKGIRSIPESVARLYDEWMFYGIDCDATSITHMCDKYGKHRLNKFKWILAFLTGDLDHDHPFCERLCEVNTWSRKSDEDNLPYKHLVTAISLDDLLDNLSLPQLDILALDIEGSEVPLFETYSWRTKPLFINVEVHTYPEHYSKKEVLQANVEKIKGIIEDQGYEMILSKPTNFRKDIHYTHEMHFLHESLSDKSKASV